MKEIKLELNEPFWGAGSVYKWTEEYNDLVGFGVNINILQNCDRVIIDTKKYGVYSIDVDKAREIKEKYNCFKKVKGTWLFIIPREACSRLK